MYAIASECRLQIAAEAVATDCAGKRSSDPLPARSTVPIGCRGQCRAVHRLAFVAHELLPDAHACDQEE